MSRPNPFGEVHHHEMDLGLLLPVLGIGAVADALRGIAVEEHVIRSEDEDASVRGDQRSAPELRHLRPVAGVAHHPNHR
jgi:hypothetical protein